MNKKGQVTIFIIVGIIIVAIVAIIFMFRDRFVGGGDKRDLDIVPIVNFVQSCVDETLNETIYAISANGGYSGYSYLNRESNEEGVRYYIFNGKNYFPSKELIESQMKEYFERKFFICINDFSNFENYNIEQGELDSYIEIAEGEVRLNLEYPLSISQDEGTSLIEDFESIIPSRLNVVYDSVAGYMIQQKNLDGTCLGCFDVAIRNDIYVDMQNYYDKSVVFKFIDQSSDLDNVPIEWRFANKY